MHSIIPSRTRPSHHTFDNHTTPPVSQYEGRVRELEEQVREYAFNQKRADDVFEHERQAWDHERTELRDRIRQLQQKYG